MNAETFLEQFGHLAEAPTGIPKLRELILQLAMIGELLPQDPNDKLFVGPQKIVQSEHRHPTDDGVIQDSRATVREGWTSRKIGEICNLRNGRAYKKPELLNAGKYRVLRVGNFFTNKNWYYSDLELDETKYCSAGDLLYAWSASFGPRIWDGEKCIFHYHIWRVDHDESLVNKEFLCHWFEWDAELVKRDRGAGATMIHVSKKSMNARLISLPPLAEQKRIVAKVDELMALCDNLEAKQQANRTKRIALNRVSLHALTEPNGTSLATAWHRVRDYFDHLYATPETVSELRQTILQLAVMGRLVPQDPNDEPASELFKRIQAEKQRLIAEGVIRKPKPLPPIEEADLPFELPTGWQWSRFGDLGITYQNGLAKRRASEGNPTTVLRLADIVHGRVSLGDTREIQLTQSERSKYALNPSDLLITRVNGSIDLVGSFTLVRVDCGPAYCDHFIRLRLLHQHIDPQFVELFGRSRLCRDAIEAAFITTAGQKTINQRHIGSLLVAVPALAEQRRIIAKVSQLMTFCDNLETKLRKTQTDADNLLTAIVHELATSARGDHQ